MPKQSKPATASVTVLTSVGLPKDLRDLIDKQAAAQERSVSKQIIHLIKKGLAQDAST
jgi:hypothetical protein|tara:strand:+ start:260 stop:433 length:174 start_codon:yes stop_codon:yes gene_type:complete